MMHYSADGQSKTSCIERVFTLLSSLLALCTILLHQLVPRTPCLVSASSCVCSCPAAWTDLPGVEMQQGKEAFAGSKVVQIRGNRLEFVLNDGAGQWDTPDPYGGSQTKNYTINAAGQYRLEAGQVSQIE